MKLPAKPVHCALLLASLVSFPAMAHAHHAEFMNDQPFLQGLSMPIHGLDHLLVAISVGLIAAQLGGNCLWAVPALFSVSVVFGGILNVMGIPVPLVELGILASIAVFGGMLAWGTRLSLLFTLGVIAVFAAFHGNALIPSDAGAQRLLLLVAGCVLSALFLQAIGIGAGLLLPRIAQGPIYRYAGFAMLLAVVVIASFPQVNSTIINAIESAAANSLPR